MSAGIMPLLSVWFRKTRLHFVRGFWGLVWLWGTFGLLQFLALGFSALPWLDKPAPSRPCLCRQTCCIYGKGATRFSFGHLTGDALGPDRFPEPSPPLTSQLPTSLSFTLSYQTPVRGQHLLSSCGMPSTVHGARQALRVGTGWGQRTHKRAKGRLPASEKLGAAMGRAACQWPCEKLGVLRLGCFQFI